VSINIAILLIVSLVTSFIECIQWKFKELLNCKCDLEVVFAGISVQLYVGDGFGFCACKNFYEAVKYGLGTKYSVSEIELNREIVRKENGEKGGSWWSGQDGDGRRDEKRLEIFLEESDE